MSKTAAQLVTEIAANLPTNTTGAITAALLRTTLLDIVAAYPNTADGAVTPAITGVIPMVNLATGTPTGAKFIRDDGTLQAIAGGGDALVANPLSQFAATTSLQLKNTISDETGSGALVFGTAPTIAGGSITALTTFGVRSTGAAFDITLATAEVLTAGRTLSLVLGDAARTITLSGNPTLSGFTATGTGTIALGAKTLTVSNTLTLAGTDFTVMTFPTTSAAIARTDAANTFTGVQTMTSAALTTPVIAGGLTASGAGSITFVGSSATFITSTGANTLSGAVTVNDATTPSITLAAGKTNTGFFQVNGKTSGALKLIAADAAAQTVTVSLAAQTTGASTLTIPDMAGVADTFAFLAKAQTFTGVITLSPATNATSGLVLTPAAWTSGSFAHVTYQSGADTGLTAATEARGWNWATSTRTWATTGTVANQREYMFNGVTYASASASQTFTDVSTVAITAPIVGTNAVFTRAHSLQLVDSTSAASSITGGLVVATTLGTTATSVGIGGGNVNAGGTVTADIVTATTSMTVAGKNISNEIPQLSKTANYTYVLTDAGKKIFHPSSDNNARTFTIDSNANTAHTIGAVLSGSNHAATACTLAITTDTLIWLPTMATGSRTIAAGGKWAAEKVTATSWEVTGVGIT